ncbi:hypothetical protein Rsub_07727 [Raphidocelis subcapitata]|uniref:NADH-ubiquinone oxidoreductase 21kDa subunit N-terminal domain-containing protein n=1 Tax=Raphidocelis subcapitata TaxID=307507 RepID=A0A2V0PB69_9CHLO|nr:hypothetical protein Rsub_07727 [Raphidocelis subcapitata]|eukprot:GBF95143.1 hypothetical protein Rsub_07727 [Raphidocelis subcapitata]
MSGDGLHQVTPPSAVVLDERKYPVVFAEPTWGQIFSHFRTEDYKLIGAAVGVGAPWGYLIGYKHHLPRQSAWFGVFMFGTAALAHTTQRVAARLLGVLPNDEEVKATGTEIKGK